jgi:hypothetical protein
MRPISLGEPKAYCVSRELHGFLHINPSFFSLHDARSLAWRIGGRILSFVPELDYHRFYFLHRFVLLCLFNAP